MTKKEKTTVFNLLLDYGRIDSYMVLSSLNRKNYTTTFDNTVMRFIRRLKESGYIRRTTRGSYSLTPRGRRFAEKYFN